MSNKRYGLYLGATALAGALCLDPSAGHAQAVPSASPFDPIINFGQTLKNNGIYFDAAYAADLNAVVAGGQKNGVMTIGHFSMAAVFDLETILGIPSASFHVGFDQRVGLSVNEIAGSPAGLIQSDAGPFQFRLGFLYWEQGFWNDRLDITLGRTNPTFDFAFSDISCTFVGQICAQPTTWYSNNLNPAYPMQSWGGRVNFQVTPEVYVRAGVYQHQFNPPFPYADHGFNWGNPVPGAFIPMEVGYQTTYRTAQYPAKYDVGGYIDTASATLPAFQGGGRTSRSAWWAQFQQAVWRPDRNTNQSLWVFGGGIGYTGHTNTWGQYYLGLFTQGPFSSRPRDTAGLIGSLYVNNSVATPAYDKQYSFELNYGFSIIPGITFKPNVVYIVNPANLTGSSGVGFKPNNAWLLGFQVAIDLGQAFEWPTFVPH